MTTLPQVNTGLQYARNEQYDKAVEEFTLLILQNRTDSDGYFYRGCAYLHLTEYEQAIDDFSSTIFLENCSHAKRLLALYKRAFSKFKINQFDSALDDYKLYVNLCKNHTELNIHRHKGQFQIGVIYAMLNQYDEAISHFTRAIEDSSGSDEDKQKWYYLHRGRAYACTAKYDQARKDLVVVCEQSQDHFIKGCAYSELGRYHDALVEFDDLLNSKGTKCKLIPISNDHIRFRRGLCHASLDRHDKALIDFKDALNDSIKQGSSRINDRILFRRGLSFMILNKPEKALINFNKSTKLNGNESDVFYARGMIQYELGHHDAAVDDYRTAIELGQTAHASQTNIYSYKSDNNKKLYIYFAKKIQETEIFLDLNHDILTRADIIRIIAEYIQKQASYSKDSLKHYENARERINEITKLPNGWRDEDTIALAVNCLTITSFITNRYSDDTASEFVIEKYIQYATDSILKTNEVFDKYINTNRNWKQLRVLLLDERMKSNTLHKCFVNEVRNMFVQYQLKKCDIIQTNLKVFSDSPAQEIFFRYFAMQLCNLFDGIRMVSTDICLLSLPSSVLKVSMIFQFLTRLFEFSSVGLSNDEIIKLDEKRIVNVLSYLGSLSSPEMLCEMAYKIAKELTIMYEEQINRLPINDEQTDTVSNSTQPEIVGCSQCTSYWKGCSHYSPQRQEIILNEMKYSSIQIVVRYAIKLLLRYFTELNIKHILNLEDIRNIFIDVICRPSFLIPSQVPLLTDTIILKDPEKKIEHWNTYEFYRRPAIKFDNGEIRARRNTDKEKFGCRKATLQEKDLYERDKLDSHGFNKFS
ncbi:hypothetical protein I4U23_028698 [Adineta vaga]|nr:hypothetical protein I4U23_028698 [Adineta vaga]